MTEEEFNAWLNEPDAARAARLAAEHKERSDRMRAALKAAGSWEEQKFNLRRHMYARAIACNPNP